MVYVVRKINWKKTPTQFRTYRNYANYDPISCSKELELNLQATDGPPSGHVNNSQSDEQDVEVLWNEFRSIFVSTADRHAPKIQKRVRRKDGCSWMTGEIKRLIRQREFLLRKARKTNKDEDWANYRRTRNKVLTNYKIWSAKSLYSRKLIAENSGDPKAFWKTLKKILPCDCKTASAPIMKVNGTNCTDKTITANSFNKCFTGVVSRLYEAIGFNVQNLSPTSARSQYQSTHSFKFERVSENDVKTKLRNLKTGKASGLDDIPARLLKDS